MRIAQKAAAGFAAVAAVAALFVMPATASAADANSNVGFTVSSSARAAAEAESYWTPERMAHAKAADIVLDGTQASNAIPRTDMLAKPVGYPAAPGLEGSAGATSAAITNGAGTAGAASLRSTAVPQPYTNLPDRLNGKVFFTKYTSGGAYAGDWVCSGTSVNSPGKSLVWTAGHCVHGGPGYGAHGNWTFVPAYSSGFYGDRPYKTWYAKELWTKAGWANNGDVSYDVGAAIVWRVDGLRLTDKIGGHGIWFGVSQFQAYTAYGYPAGSPFNGYLQYSCTSGPVAFDNPGSGPSTTGILCDMTGGSSGGGWVINIDANGLGRVNSVNSYGYASNPDVMYGPYHGDSALALFDFVKNKTA